MLSLFRTKTFLKDYKKLNISDKHYNKYIVYLGLLLNRLELPKEALNHPLKGNFIGFYEFHISGDLLIVYCIEDNFLKLIRIGTHSKIFK